MNSFGVTGPSRSRPQNPSPPSESLQLRAEAMPRILRRDSQATPATGSQGRTRLADRSWVLDVHRRYP